MARLGLAGAHTNQIWTAYPTKFEADGVGADASSLNRVGKKT